MNLVPPITAPAGLREWMQSVADAIGLLEVPQGPVPAYAILEADLPPAASYQNCVVLVADLDILAISNGVDWVRQDTGAPI